MTTEQMIAWLVLEGWEPVQDTRVDTDYTWQGIRLNDRAVYRGRFEGDAWSGYEAHEVTRAFEKPRDWATYSAEEIQGMYAALNQA